MNISDSPQYSERWKSNATVPHEVMLAAEVDPGTHLNTGSANWHSNRLEVGKGEKWGHLQ